MKCGLLGEKLGHSFSPRIHNLLTDRYSYELFEVERDNLENFIKAKEYDGLNVTIPYKKDVMKYLDHISKRAQKIECVNTIRNDGGVLYGDNTDYDGFLYLLRKLRLDVSGKKVLVLGSGGGSLTARTVLHEEGAADVVIISRSGENNYQNLCRHSDAKVIVNTTPVGMYPANLESSLDIGLFPELEAVIDIVYNPLLTKILLDARKRGIRYINGLPMLVSQAKRACEVFTGEEISDDETEKIVKMLSKEKENIVLIGMPGSGKTHIGSVVAEKTGRTHIDLDTEISLRAGMPTSAFLEKAGEEEFRKLESSIVADAGKTNGTVISTGGGVVTREENYNPLKQNGVIVLLNRPLKDLETKDRPLSKKKTVEVLYEERKDLYDAFSDIKIECGNVSETAEMVMNGFLGYEE